VAGFQQTAFHAARHAQTEFPLVGRHVAVECGKCHKPLVVNGAPLVLAASHSGGAATVPRQFHFPSLACGTCHADPHQTKLACDTCHTPEQWKAVRAYQHPPEAKARVEGAHQKLACIECHKPSAAADAGGAAQAAPRFGGTPTQCLGCHAARDAHGGQFMSDPEEDCSKCHVIEHWNGEAFSHDRARYTLNRVHRNLECAKCHKQQREAAGKKYRVYRGTPPARLGCHN